MIKKEAENVVPVFYAADENYLPFLGVALASLKANASKERIYRIHVLTSGKLHENAKKIKEMQTENIRVSFHDVSERIEEIINVLHCRDYYTPAIFYRLFIPDLFPQYDKAIYLDCDTVLCADIAQLYDIDIKENLIGAVADQAVADVVAFREYTKNALGISAEKYFNSGVITLNLKKLREMNFFQAFFSVLSSYAFIVAPDQDCLNLICKNKVHYYSKAWNAMPIGGKRIKPKLVHYNLSLKPWHYDDVLYEEYFWEYAKQTPFLETIEKKKSAFTPEMAERDRVGGERLIALAQAEADSEHNYLATVQRNGQNNKKGVGRYGFITDFSRSLGGDKANFGI
ncbi:MAG: glycosyltransferase family 8 protein [Clostridia bacterium]|nr:glycosyltransferase family 8 protein [Clostridia bacterium]